MNSPSRILILIGGVFFALITIWSLYWTIALQCYGCPVSVEIIAHGSPGGASKDDKLIEIRSVYKYKDGNEEVIASRVDSLSAPPVGTRMRFYILTGPIERLTDVKVPGDWYYAWTPPALFFTSTCMFLWTWWIIPRACSIFYRYILGCALLIVLIIIYHSNSFGSVLNIMDYVAEQRHVLNT
jgi:hypothetical protein